MSPEIFELTKRGLRVFPLAPGSKIPPRGSDWTNTATADAFQAYDDFVGVPGANIGVLANGFVIVDADTKTGDGIAEALALIGDVQTFTVTTPSGGRHFYFDAGGELFANAVRIRPNVDIRAANGYVVAPGSQIGGKRYAVTVDAPIAPLPASVRALLTAKRDAAPIETATIGDVDTAGAIASATAYLKAAPLAVEGNGGDNCTIRVANRVMDFGVSPETAVDLMADHWNDRCSPPWDYEDLHRKVFSAAKSKQDAIGRDNPNNFFEDVEPPPAPVDDFASAFFTLELSTSEIEALSPIDWVIPNLLARRLCTVLTAPGGTGKSLTALQWAVAVACGGVEGIAGPELTGPPKRVLLINYEDDRGEMQRRLAAIQKAFNVTKEMLGGRIVALDLDRRRLKLATRGKGGVIAPTPDCEKLRAMLKAGDFALIVGDPIIEAHDANENDNGEMAEVMAIIKGLARDANAAFLAVAHSRKPSEASASGMAGDMYANRGASSVVNAARIQLTQFNMSADDAKQWGVDERERYKFVRLDYGKFNIGLLQPAPTWFKRVSIDLGAAGSGGVLKHEKLHDKTTDIVAEAMKHIAKACTSQLSLSAAVDYLQANDAFFANASKNSIRQKLIGAFADGKRFVANDGFRFEPNGDTGGKIIKE